MLRRVRIGCLVSSDTVWNVDEHIYMQNTSGFVSVSASDSTSTSVSTSASTSASTSPNPLYLSISLSLYLSISLPLYLSISLPLYLSTSLSFYLIIEDKDLESKPTYYCLFVCLIQLGYL
jgi:hypothetical protein